MGIYFTHAIFSVSKDTEVIKTTVGNFISGDAVIGAYLDGEYSKTIPGKNDGYVVEKVVCDNNATGEWDDDVWGIALGNLTKRTKCNVYFKKNLANKVSDLAKNDTTNFASDDIKNNIRYIGGNPNNYVYFNCSDYANQSADTCEVWRIIGVFNDVTKSDGSNEKLVKIVRANSLGDFIWDYKKNGVGTSNTDNGSSDWSDSQLMMMLNPIDYLKSGYTNSNNVISFNGNQLYSKMGSYYNGTSGCAPADITVSSTFSCNSVDFTSTGLKNDTTRKAIEEVIWNIGGSSTYSDVTPSMFYERERGSEVYSGHATIWKGKVGLMYPSDYGYATSGGTTTSRASCLAKELYNWNVSGFTDCENNDYLFDTSNWQWTLISNNELSSSVFRIGSSGFVGRYRAQVAGAVHPVVYLKSNITVSNGDGSLERPYELEIR